MIEYGIEDIKKNKIIRLGFSKDQALSFIGVHISDCFDSKINPWFRIIYREISNWEKLK